MTAALSSVLSCAELMFAGRSPSLPSARNPPSVVFVMPADAPFAAFTLSPTSSA
jgi:hypothetical protein